MVMVESKKLLAMDYMARNIKVFMNGVKGYAKDISEELVSMLIPIAQRMVDMIDNNFNMPDGSAKFPVWTANLHDATGVGIYRDGALTRYIPTKRATKTQKMGGLGRRIDGHEELMSALTDGAVEFSKGIWIVLFSAVPYAYNINAGVWARRGAGFFEETKQGMLNEVLAGLAPLKPTIA